VDVETLAGELDLAVGEVVAGRLWEEERFKATAAEMRRLNDIAFSGDGEPTCVSELPAAVRAAADTRERFSLDELKLILITNASRLGDAPFREARAILDANNGEIWVKLDAGTEAWFQRINHPLPPVTLEMILANIAGLAAARPIVIQTLLCRLDGELPPEDEIAAYCRRVREITAGGGQIKLVQLHTIARSPTSSSVATLSDAALDAIAETVRPAIAPVPVEVYYGQDVPPQGTV
jgi:wyosine [tRNA(Phe)-imidazoG37] synthetase (radical SAM superfamily)